MNHLVQFDFTLVFVVVERIYFIVSCIRLLKDAFPGAFIPMIDGVKRTREKNEKSIQNCCDTLPGVPATSALLMQQPQQPQRRPTQSHQRPRTGAHATMFPLETASRTRRWEQQKPVAPTAVQPNSRQDA
jgi:hypothetical protein